MGDPEFRQMVNKAVFAVSVALVFAIPLFFVFKNKLYVTESDLLKDIRNKKTVMLYITDNDCSNCKSLKRVLDKNDMEYEELNKDSARDYKRIIELLGLNSSSIYAPTLIYVEEGEVISYIVDIESKERLNDYIKNYK